MVLGVNPFDNVVSAEEGVLQFPAAPILSEVEFTPPNLISWKYFLFPALQSSHILHDREGPGAESQSGGCDVSRVAGGPLWSLPG